MRSIKLGPCNWRLADGAGNKPMATRPVPGALLDDHVLGDGLLLAHEPPALSLLPDAGRTHGLAFLRDTCELSNAPRNCGRR